ncbi:MAG: toll/interleukin-1 receptor domain-containing protein [Rhodanobacteraceae bacterium]|nr:MAG: toll/interleukin-1 receptor domain-containing protein [Rhodanobacteraceae bacterium]
MPESSSGSSFTYRAFISYSHRDKAWADWLHRSLETYRVPSRLVGKQTAAGVIPRRLNPIFRDREELSSSPELGSKINQALAQSENLIVLCSPASATSRWVNEEVLAYKRMGRARHIFCLIVEGEPNATDRPGREAEECFCPALRFATDTDGRPTNERTEPIAADAREGKDGKANAKLKLVAGMLGVGFDALKQRELQRRTRRMTAIAALALGVMAVTSVLAVYALISRHQAVIAQHQAVVAQQAAQRRQKQAEGLVNFMLGDLTGKLNEVHRLDILQAVDNKAMAYFKSLPATDVNDAALEQRAKALEAIGTVRMQQGQQVAARQAFLASTRISSQLAASAPMDAARQMAYANTLNFIGFTYWDEGNLEAAQQNFILSQASLLHAQKMTKGSPKLDSQLATTINNIGHVHEARGNLNAAIAAYRSMLALLQSVVSDQPKNMDWKNLLGNAWDDLGKVELEQGHLDRAITDYRTDQNLREAMSAGDPANHDELNDLMVSDAILGRTLALYGDMQGALRYTLSAVDIGKSLVKFEPADTDNQDDLALYSSQLGGLLRQTGQVTAAAVADAEGVAIFSTLVSRDPKNSGWNRGFAQARIELAQLKLRQGDTGAARSSVDDALQLLESLRRTNASDPALALLAAQANLIMGEISAKQGDTAEAHKAWIDARTAVADKSISNDPNALAAVVRACLLLDDTAAARPSLAKLSAMGYRTPDFDALLDAKHVTYTVDPRATARINAAINEPVNPLKKPL